MRNISQFASKNEMRAHCQLCRATDLLLLQLQLLLLLLGVVRKLAGFALLIQRFRTMRSKQSNSSSQQQRHVGARARCQKRSEAHRAV